MGEEDLVEDLVENSLTTITSGVIRTILLPELHDSPR